VQRWSVWFMSLISAGMAVASVVVNDYFDLKLDASNAPDKPLPSGACGASCMGGGGTAVLGV
jgi:4-hydroxybenzoate polyprenyltransferase